VGINAGGYQYANDAQVIASDLTVPGLFKPGSSQALSLGGTGHSFRISLNNSPGLPDQTGTTNATDSPDPNAGTDGTLQASDTAGTGYYSLAIRVTDIATLNATGGTLLGFNNFVNGQTGNPATVGAGLTIRPKAGGNPGEFELGVVKQGASNFANAAWDTTNVYTTNSTIFVVGKYQTVGVPGNPTPPETDDIASLWINPSPATFGGFDPAGALTNTGLLSGNDIPTNASTFSHTLQSFLLRQTANNQTPAGIIYDELRVGTSYADVTPPIPEPGTLGLTAIVIGMACCIRRRQ
jgi:hypothetical protein